MSIHTPIFPEKSDKFSDKFGCRQNSEVFIGYFDMSTFQKYENLVKILRNFSDNFIDRTKPSSYSNHETGFKPALFFFRRRAGALSLTVGAILQRLTLRKMTWRFLVLIAQKSF